MIFKIKNADCRIFCDFQLRLDFNYRTVVSLLGVVMLASDPGILDIKTGVF